jgi:putative protease
MRKLELLSPAGDMERLKMAVLYGADAVYLAGTAFGMRAGSANFDFDTLKKTCEIAHARGVKVYLTCNTLPTNEEIAQLPEYLKNAAACGIDALIVADVYDAFKAELIIRIYDVSGRTTDF